MSDWKECEILSREIVLSIKRKPITITEISKRTRRAKSTVSEAVEILKKQGIVTKTHNYQKDARTIKIVLNPSRVKIEKTHSFYIIYFILSFIPLVTSAILSLIFKQVIFVIGCVMGVLPSFLYIIHEAYVKGDKTTVYKNPKQKSKVKAQEEKISFGNPNKLVRGTETTDPL